MSAQGLVTQRIADFSVGVALTLVLERRLGSFLDGRQSVLDKMPGNLISLKAFILHFKDASQEVVRFHLVLVLWHCAPVGSRGWRKADEVGQTGMRI